MSEQADAEPVADDRPQEKVAQSASEMETEPQLPPPPQPVQTTPEAFRLRGDPPRVMRLSRKTLAAIGVVAGAGIGGSLLYALQPVSHGDATNLYDTDSRNKADVVTSAPSDYSTVPKLGPPLPGDLGRPIVSAQENGKDIPSPTMGSPAARSPDPRLATAEQARQRAAQERDSARTSTLFLGNEGAAGAGAATALPAMADTAMAGSAPATPSTPQATPAGQNEKRAFLKAAGSGTYVSPERVAPPVSPNVLQAGSVIPAALITGIRSDLPGQITAQVTQNVYDSPTGRILLIAQGSRLIGVYDSDVAAGQTRVLLAWDRLILPGGRSILLDRQPGADSAGMAGLADRTNWHWGNVLKAALVSTLLGIGTELAANGDDDLTRALRYGTQGTINQTGQQLVQRQVQVPATLTVRPGYPLRVLVTRDLILEPALQEDMR